MRYTDSHTNKPGDENASQTICSRNKWTRNWHFPGLSTNNARSISREREQEEKLKAAEKCRCIVRSHFFCISLPSHPKGKCVCVRNEFFGAIVYARKLIYIAVSVRCARPPDSPESRLINFGTSCRPRDALSAAVVLFAF
jgi:hypothetical protein